MQVRGKPVANHLFFTVPPLLESEEGKGSSIARLTKTTATVCRKQTVVVLSLRGFFS